MEIDNKSSRVIKERKVTLKQYIKFRAEGKTKTVLRKVKFIRNKNQILEKTLQKWNDGITIPAVASSSNNTCKIIYISYKLDFSFELDENFWRQDLFIPITIGRVVLSKPLSNN